MEHKLAQRRLLICAVFFSFGAMSGAMTLMRLSESAISGVKNALVSLVLKGPFLVIPAVFLIFPLLLLLAGSSASGCPFICGLLGIAGFVGGFHILLSLHAHYHPYVMSAFFALYGFCLLSLGSCMLRKSSLLRKQIAFSGMISPDYGYDALRAACALLVILMAAFAMACFILSM